MGVVVWVGGKMLVGGGRAIFKHKKLSILINVMIIQTYLDIYIYICMYKYMFIQFIFYVACFIFYDDFMYIHK